VDIISKRADAQGESAPTNQAINYKSATGERSYAIGSGSMNPLGSRIDAQPLHVYKFIKEGRRGRKNKEEEEEEQEEEEE